MARSSAPRVRVTAFVPVAECPDGAAFTSERMLDGLPNGPTAFGRGRIQLLIRQAEQRADQLRTGQVIVHKKRLQTRIAPALQQTQFVADIPHLTGVLLFVKDVVHQQIPS